MILLKANLKHHKGSMAGIGALFLIIPSALGTVLTVWGNSQAYIREEIARAGFGNLTAWVSGIQETADLAEDMTALPKDIADLAESIAALPDIERVETQSLIFSNYEINGQESDSEGQLITFFPEENRYRFFTDDLSAYTQDMPHIAPGESYVSPSILSMFETGLGDEIRFPIARNGKDKIFTIEGFYEDPFMGSSMIGMKGFLISEEDRRELLEILQNAGIDALARNGAMVHIFSSRESMTVSELNSILNEQTALPEYAEFVHSKEAICGFMLILQNAFGALMAAFVLVLFLAAGVVLWHSISSLIETDTINMGILKTVGFTSKKLQKIQCLLYLIPIAIGIGFGLLLAVPAERLAGNATLATIGVKIPAKLPLQWWSFCTSVMLFLIMGFVFWRTGKVGEVTPMKAIRREGEKLYLPPGTTLSIPGRALHLRLAFRQLLTWKRRYLGALFVAAILVFFASLVGRMNSWLGSDGKGMMDAFNPADHDIGVQLFGSLTVEEMEDTVSSYTDITDVYQLAMPELLVNGMDYTANVITEPERFHILEGRTCIRENEIVVTEFVARDFGVSVGDIVTVQGNKGIGEYRISGIYSCANDMGNNMGMSRESYLNIGRDIPQLWCWHYFLKDPLQKAAIAEALEAAYGGDVHIHENTWPGLFGIIAAMKWLLVLMYAMAAVFVLIVTVMTGSKILMAEQRELGIYKAIGLGTRSLRLTFALRFGMIALAGAVMGSAFAAFFSDPLVSAVMKAAGISNFASRLNAWNALLPGSVVVLLFFGFAWLLSGKMKQVSLRVLIME